MSPLPPCQCCKKPVGLGDLLLSSGPVCQACDRAGLVAPESLPPTSTTTNEDGAPRAGGRPESAHSEENKGRHVPAGDRAASILGGVGGGLVDFVLEDGARSAAIEVEEWIYVPFEATWQVASTPRDRYPGRLASVPRRAVRFAVVLEWFRVSQYCQAFQGRLFRDIGAVTALVDVADNTGRRDALNAARAWGAAQAARLAREAGISVAAPYGFVPARPYLPEGVA